MQRTPPEDHVTAEPTITCPKCQSEIRLTDSLAAPLLAEVRKSVAGEEARKARALVDDELAARTREIAELREIAAVRTEKLAAAQKAHAEVLKKERALEDRERELNLTVERRVQDEVVAAREQARREVDERMQLKLSEKDLTLDAMRRQLEEMKRRMEQGSQQAQGEVLELELEALLATRFPCDTIVPVPKGEFGGDVVQRVCSPAGHACGSILWESKRTKNWSDLWLPKLKQDQREAKAEVAILVSTALPRGLEGFEFRDSVWVVHPRFALALASVLRSSLVELAAQRVAGQGLATKSEQLYAYVTGPRFRQRVAAVVEAFMAMQDDLQAEKRSTQRQWSKRQAQIDRVLLATSGMWGDVEGMTGRSLPEIEGLALPEPLDSVG
jgi:hypothetical protein